MKIVFLLIPLFAFASPIGYVTQQSLGIVGTFDANNSRIGVSIPVEKAPKYVTTSPDGKYLYVVNTESSCVSIIATKGYKKIGKLLVEDPAGIAIDQRAEKGYVVGEDALYSFDVEKQMLEESVVKIHGYGARNLLLSEDGKTAYISLNDAICFVDLVRKVAINLPLEGDFAGMCLTPDGKYLCVVSTFLPASFVCIDTQTKQIIRTISLDNIAQGARSLVITHDGKTAYITAQMSGNLVPIDLATWQVGTPISVGVFPKDIAITPDGSTIFVANFISDNVTPVDVATRTAKPPIVFQDECVGITIAPVTLVENLHAEQTKSRFLSTDVCSNHLSWEKAAKADTEKFLVWKNGLFFKEVSANSPLYFEDRRIKKSIEYTYTIVAVSPSGTYSKPYTIKVP